MRGAASRSVVAGALIATALAGLLVAWFLAGWSDVRARQDAIRAAPDAVAKQAQAELARVLRGELARLVAREVQRPYYDYRNLIHDPRSGNAAPSVTPSPLAAMPDDPLVRGYFQIDARGVVTTPTINEASPELSEQAHLAANRAFRDACARDLAATLRPAPVVAAATPPRPPAQRIELDNNSYMQNAEPQQVYAQQRVARVQVVPAPVGSVTITVSPLDWRTLPFDGGPALVAVRDVATPDGRLVQGFVVDRAALTVALVANNYAASGATHAELRHGDGDDEVAPGWRVAVAVGAAARATADATAGDIAEAFVVRFVLVGLLATVAGVLAVLLVARAERLARERSQFAAAAAHELRTPLAGLQLYGDMLAGGLGDPAKQTDYAKRMSEEAARLGRVVSNVLGFSQLERGNLHVSAEPGALADALREFARRAEPALDRAGCTLALDVEPELAARFDRDALARIVGNLLDNAEKYARGAADRTIAVTARRGADRVEVVVADRGPGVAAPARRRLFRPFARGVDGDGPAGLGLGLALSRSLARAMGGELAYRPAADGGAAFVLRLVPA